MDPHLTNEDSSMKELLEIFSGIKHKETSAKPENKGLDQDIINAKVKTVVEGFMSCLQDAQIDEATQKQFIMTILQAKKETQGG